MDKIQIIKNALYHQNDHNNYKKLTDND